MSGLAGYLPLCYDSSMSYAADVVEQSHDAVVALIRLMVPGCEFVYLLGGGARGRSHPGSDVDLALLAAAPVPALVRHDLGSRLAGLVACDVDLIDLATASSVMRKEVVAYGVLWFERLPELGTTFEGRVLSEYARLNDERRPILERIAREGHI